jgi:hypothetical protein
MSAEAVAFALFGALVIGFAFGDTWRWMCDPDVRDLEAQLLDFELERGAMVRARNEAWDATVAMSRDLNRIAHEQCDLRDELTTSHEQNTEAWRIITRLAVKVARLERERAA